MKLRQEKVYSQLVRFITVLMCLLFILCASIPALAEEEPEPQPTPVIYNDYNAQHEAYEDKIYLGLYNPISDDDLQASNDLFQIRQTLNNDGYYENITLDFGLNYLSLGDMQAVQAFWHEKTGENYPTPLGLTYGAMDLILAPPAPTEAPHEYQDIPWMEGSEDLKPLLNRLYRLGYLEDVLHEVYDEDVREALRLFCENNGLPSYYDEDENRPITVELQRMLIEGDVKELNPMPEPEPERPVPYFLRIVNVLGIEMRMWVLWTIGLVVLVAGVLAVIYLFVPSDKKGEKKKSNVVRFSITYQGKTQQTEAEITKTLKIGRGIGNFPLNLEDAKISRRHCELYYLNGALMLRDYSSNGTTVNGKPVHNAECLLSSGDVIAIGNHTITITF